MVSASILREAIKDIPGVVKPHKPRSFRFVNEPKSVKQIKWKAMKFSKDTLEMWNQIAKNAKTWKRLVMMGHEDYHPESYDEGSHLNYQSYVLPVDANSYMVSVRVKAAQALIAAGLVKKYGHGKYSKSSGGGLFLTAKGKTFLSFAKAPKKVRTPNEANFRENQLGG